MKKKQLLLDDEFELQPIHHTVVQKVCERLALMPAKDRRIVINKPPTTDCAADGLYRRRCKRWKILTTARGISGTEEYQREQALKQKMETLVARNEWLESELARVKVLLARERLDAGRG